MEALTVVLLVCGIISIAASFVLNYKEQHTAEKTDTTLTQNQIKQIEKQVNILVEEQINKIVSEKLENSREEIEAEMDKISNIKILEINEYADGVLKQINKNHNEAVFLYEMLAEKTKDVKKTIADNNKVGNNVENMKPKRQTGKKVTKPQVLQDSNNNNIEKKINKDILNYYRIGKTSVEIAKELNLGVGEVQLVIDLYNSSECGE